MQKTTHSLVEWFFLARAEPRTLSKAKGERPTLKQRHNGGGVGSGGGGVYCEGVADFI